MGIDIEREEPITLAMAAGKIGVRRAGKKTNVSTLHRWSTTGLRGVVLETLQAGGVKVTSLAALQRFFDALSAGSSSKGSTTQRSHEAVEAALDAEGIKVGGDLSTSPAIDARLRLKAQSDCKSQANAQEQQRRGAPRQLRRPLSDLFDEELDYH